MNNIDPQVDIFSLIEQDPRHVINKLNRLLLYPSGWNEENMMHATEIIARINTKKSLPVIISYARFEAHKQPKAVASKVLINQILSCLCYAFGFGVIQGRNYLSLTREVNTMVKG
jgi:hypothetical protein